ncbi:AraC family transcriptional regulator [Thioclava sp. SK-1]|uniref:AraC family transcriptional regulator n=1 Tax=Thioclava sp. SK-1 TaxID=1889770 RepID=UPI002100AFED|nr:AraC family transcriptional regulator [Thioclava sp. SK-1]
MSESILARIPPSALSLVLVRSAIRMQHTPEWSIEKSLPVEDMIIALEGRGEYQINDERFHLDPGEAMLLRRGETFRGWTNSKTGYVGLAQHFTLGIYGETDLIAQMKLKRKVRFSRWPELGAMIRTYRDTAPPSSVTLLQHYQFMVMLIAFVDDAFLGWQRDGGMRIDSSAGIDLAVMKAAARISTAPLEPEIAAQAVRDAPYNPDYFHREFRDRLGRTPRQYQEFCRIERAMLLLERGLSPSQVAREIGYADPYYFSRAFKRQAGQSPRGYQQHVRRAQTGQLIGPQSAR